jgi:hypothetical protein
MGNVDVIMSTTWDIVIQRLQKGREVVLPMVLATPWHPTIEAATMLAVIPYHASDMHHTRTISRYQGKEHIREYFAL